MTTLQILDIILFIFILKWSHNCYTGRKEAERIIAKANILLAKAEEHQTSWEQAVYNLTRDNDDRSNTL